MTLFGLDVVSDDSHLHESDLGKAVSPQELYDLITNRIIDLIEKDKTLAWRKPWTVKNQTGIMASNYVSKKPYRGINAFMLNLVYPLFFNKRWKSPYFLTFKQVDALGGKIKKGAEGIEVFYFGQVFKKGSEKITEDEYLKCRGQQTDDCDDISQILILRYYNVFSADDVEGIDFEKPKNVDIPQNENEKIQSCEAIIEHFPNPVPKLVFADPTGAYYTPVRDTVNMPPMSSFDSSQEFYSTFFHELIHSTGAEKRLNRTMSGKMNSKEYAFEELIAELGASYLNAEAGILYFNLKNSAAYLKGWRNALLKHIKEDNKFFFKAASAAQKAVDYVLQYDEEAIPLYRQKVNGKPKQTKRAIPGKDLNAVAFDLVTRYASMNGRKVKPTEATSLLRDIQRYRFKESDPQYRALSHITGQLTKLAKVADGKTPVTIKNVEKYRQTSLLGSTGLGVWPLIASYFATKAVDNVISRSTNLIKDELTSKTDGLGCADLQCTCSSIPAPNLGSVSFDLTPKREVVSNSIPAMTLQPIIELPRPITRPTAAAETSEFVKADNRVFVKAPGTFRLPGEMGKLLQDIQPFKYSIAITGDPHAGKTEFVTQLIDAFLSAGKTVGLFSIEQGGLESKDTVRAIDRNVSRYNQGRLSVAGEAKEGINSLKKAAGLFDVVVVDSWQKLRLPNTHFDSLRHEHPNTIWVIIFQQNGEGGTRGGVASDYDTPVALKVHKVDLTFVNNYVELVKNRGNSLNWRYTIASKKAEETLIPTAKDLM